MTLRRFPKLSRAGLSRLAFQAQRVGSKGYSALAVLQDSLQEQYPRELKASIRQAKERAKRRGGVQTILFLPTMERAIGKTARQLTNLEASDLIFSKVKAHNTSQTMVWRQNQRWPFLVTSNPHNRSRGTSVVVWDTVNGWDVHHWVPKRKLLTKREKTALVYALRFGSVYYGAYIELPYRAGEATGEIVTVESNSLESLIKKKLLRDARAEDDDFGAGLPPRTWRRRPGVVFRLTGKGRRIAQKIEVEGITDISAVRDPSKRRKFGGGGPPDTGRLARKRLVSRLSKRETEVSRFVKRAIKRIH